MSIQRFQFIARGVATICFTVVAISTDGLVQISSIIAAVCLAVAWGMAFEAYEASKIRSKTQKKE